MKQFLYLDYDMVNSIIAQAEKGVILTYTNEESNTDSNTSDKTTSTNSKAEIGGSLLGILQGNTNVDINHSRNHEEQRILLTKEIVSKSLHDAAFDIALSYITPKQEEQNEAYDFGDYCLLERNYDFVDFDYLGMLLSKDGIMGFLKDLSKKEIEAKICAADNGLNRNQIRSANKAIQSRINKLVNSNNVQYDNANNILNIIKKMIPYSRMLFSKDGFLIPLANEYFRIKPENLGFKYGGNMTCVGIITNILNEKKDSDNMSIFAELQFSINEILKAFLPTNNNTIYVIHPIAIYYENKQKEE